MEDTQALTTATAHSCLGPAPGPLHPAHSRSTCTPDDKDSAQHKGVQGQPVVGLLEIIHICALPQLQQQEKHSTHI